ncbi:MAG TPA: acyltransferase, partial [Flavisolibacter sp.]|nr:acyltransferase [Flavisolibacter sp.]
MITYLLLKEKSQTGKVDVKKFYVRRILRIWPLYYVCLVIGFIIFPVIKLFMGVPASEPARPLYYIFLVSNFDIIHHLPDSSQLSILWSIAVEEQFYLAWPVIVAFSSRKILPYVLLTIIAGSLVFRLFNSTHPDVIKYHTISCVSDMAVGGCAAYFSIYSKRFLWSMKWMNSFALAFIYSGGFIIYLFRHEIFFGIGLAFDRLVISLFFALIIVEQNYSANSYFKMKNLVGPSLMGQYTYGLYCLSPIGILSAHIVLSKLGWNNTLVGLIVLEGVLSLAVTIFLAVFSYHFIEKRFLELKERFAVVKTMPIVKKEIGLAEKQNV